MQIHVQQTEITDISVDAVVNPANSQGTMGEGIAEAIRRRGGEEIEAAAKSAAPIAVGAATVTKAGSLPAKHVIHAPTMDRPGVKVGAEHIRRAARAALIAANANSFQEVAFPSMGTGAGGVEAAEAARAIVEEIRAHKRAFPHKVYLVDPSDEMIEAFELALDNAQLGL
ncbi:MAG: macro domain-containing protein [Proteobacteria bacterium]|nr:macro domain-containing protein [Pseudomonadota bacterium]